MGRGAGTLSKQVPRPSGHALRSSAVWPASTTIAHSSACLGGREDAAGGGSMTSGCRHGNGRAGEQRGTALSGWVRPVLSLSTSATQCGSRCTSPSVSEATCRHHLERCGTSSFGGPVGPALGLGRGAHGVLSAVDLCPGSQSSPRGSGRSMPCAFSDPTWRPSRPVSSLQGVISTFSDLGLAPASLEALPCGSSGTTEVPGLHGLIAAVSLQLLPL